MGDTVSALTKGYPRLAHSVGHFKETRLLERMILAESLLWSVTEPVGQKSVVDVDKLLRDYVRNADVLKHFHYYRSDVELTFRLNTNQFYYGALMLTMWPGTTTGQRLDERAVLDPTIISASLGDSVVKTWSYSWPMAWKRLDGATKDSYPTNFSIDILAPLTRAKEDMPDTVTIQMWARFKNIELAFPTGPTNALDELVPHSGTPQVMYLNKATTSHPVKDERDTVGKAVDAVKSITIGDGVKAVQSLAKFVTSNWGSFMQRAFFMLDKPDEYSEQTAAILEASKDMYCTDIRDTNVSISMYKARYVDPSLSRMPMSSNFTVSDYARIPGLRNPLKTWTPTDSSGTTIIPIQLHPTTATLKIPLDYAYAASYMWRGSVKIALQFFTSAFISARFSVNINNLAEFPAGPPIDYSNGLSRVIDVKGDTLDTFTVPWLSSVWWSDTPTLQIVIRLVSRMASVDATVDPKIYMLAWVAGGDDIQFAFPSIVTSNSWAGPASILDEGESLNLPEGETLEPHCSIGGLFTSTFPPIGEDTFYDIDNGYCTSEMLGPITDIAKRYAKYEDLLSTNFDSKNLDAWETPGSANYGAYRAFRRTHYGTWRSAFLMRSGGYRWRFFTPEAASLFFTIDGQSDAKNIRGTDYCTPIDKMHRLTVPQVSPYPYTQLGFNSYLPRITHINQPVSIGRNMMFLAARDDVQFGYPILPAGLSP